MGFEYPWQAIPAVLVLPWGTLTTPVGFPTLDIAGRPTSRNLVVPELGGFPTLCDVPTNWVTWVRGQCSGHPLVQVCSKTVNLVSTDPEQSQCLQNDFSDRRVARVAGRKERPKKLLIQQDQNALENGHDAHERLSDAKLAVEVNPECLNAFFSPVNGLLQSEVLQHFRFIHRSSLSQHLWGKVTAQRSTSSSSEHLIMFFLLGIKAGTVDGLPPPLPPSIPLSCRLLVLADDISAGSSLFSTKPALFKRAVSQIDARDLLASSQTAAALAQPPLFDQRSDSPRLSRSLEVA
eukprot:1286595-Rhodomonas_salina.3